jgi:hypothetical protein
VSIEHVALFLVPSYYRKIDVFLSYTRRDRVWFRRLRRVLQPLREFDIVLWTDQDLLAGQEWDELIKSKVAGSGAAVLLVSEAFLSSEYVQANELAPFVARAERNRLRSEDRPFLLLWIPLAHERLLQQDDWGKRLLRFQWLVNPRRPLAATPPAGAQRVLEQIRDLVHVTIHKQLRNTES